MAKKKATKKNWGGRRKGAGRPKGTGTGRGVNCRDNRIAVMFSDAELAKLKKLATRKKMKLATLAYMYASMGLRSAR